MLVAKHARLPQIHLPKIGLSTPVLYGSISSLLPLHPMSDHYCAESVGDVGLKNGWNGYICIQFGENFSAGDEWEGRGEERGKRRARDLLCLSAPEYIQSAAGHEN